MRCRDRHPVVGEEQRQHPDVQRIGHVGRGQPRADQNAVEDQRERPEDGLVEERRPHAGEGVEHLHQNQPEDRERQEEILRIRQLPAQRAQRQRAADDQQRREHPRPEQPRAARIAAQLHPRLEQKHGDQRDQDRAPARVVPELPGEVHWVPPLSRNPVPAMLRAPSGTATPSARPAARSPPYPGTAVATARPAA